MEVLNDHYWMYRVKQDFWEEENPVLDLTEKASQDWINGKGEYEKGECEREGWKAKPNGRALKRAGPKAGGGGWGGGGTEWTAGGGGGVEQKGIHQGC